MTHANVEKKLGHRQDWKGDESLGNGGLDCAL